MPIPSYIPILSDYTDDQLFSVTNIVLPAWLLIALAPKSKLTSLIVFSVVIVLSTIYSLTFLSGIEKYGGMQPMMDMFMSLDGVTKLFSDRSAVLVGWVHYGVTDLLTGYWEAHDAVDRGISRFIMFPILFLSMMFGPVGVLLYLIVRSFFRKKVPRRKTG